MGLYFVCHVALYAKMTKPIRYRVLWQFHKNFRCQKTVVGYQDAKALAGHIMLLWRIKARIRKCT